MLQKGSTLNIGGIWATGRLWHKALPLPGTVQWIIRMWFTRSFLFLTWPLLNSTKTSKNTVIILQLFGVVFQIKTLPIFPTETRHEYLTRHDNFRSQHDQQLWRLSDLLPHGQRNNKFDAVNIYGCTVAWCIYIVQNLATARVESCIRSKWQESLWWRGFPNSLSTDGVYSLNKTFTQAQRFRILFNVSTPRSRQSCKQSSDSLCPNTAAT